MIQHINTLLPLYSWFKILGISPWEGAQIGEGLPLPSTGQCQSVFFEQPYHRDYLSRYEVQQAIDEAEHAIAEQLGFFPAPKYLFDEHVELGRGTPLLPSMCGVNAWGWWKGVSLKWGEWQSGGVFNRTLISAAVVVTMNDAYGDGVDESFTVTFATTVTDPDELALYFAAADRQGEAVSETWRIRPIKTTISAGTAPVTGHATLLVVPDLTTAMDAAVLDVNDPIYITTVDAYRAYTDTTHSTSFPYQGTAIWDVPDDCTDADCSVQILPLCQGEGRGGRIYVDYGDPSGWPYSYQADSLRLNYRAGYPLDDNGQMNRELARMVAYLATALLPSDKCGCERSNRILHAWRAKPNEGDAGRNFTAAEIDSNPFVERVGAIWTWKRVMSWREMGAVSV